MFNFKKQLHKKPKLSLQIDTQENIKQSLLTSQITFFLSLNIFLITVSASVPGLSLTSTYTSSSVQLTQILLKVTYPLGQFNSITKLLKMLY